MTDELSQVDEVEPWLRLSTWEQQCVDEAEKTPDMEVGFQNEKDCAVQKLWFLFQNAATGIAQLYKDRQHGVSLWVPFQNAASNVTALYKESTESQKRFFDMGFQCGYQRRNKDLISWAKKRKRQIQREDLIAYLTGRTPPQQKNWAGPRPRLSLDGVRSLSSRIAHSHRLSAMDPDELRGGSGEEPNFDIFREALGFSASLRQNTGSPISGYSRTHRTRHGIPSTTSHSELSSFIAEEFVRHGECRKRSPPADVIMDSPTHKRSKLSSHIL